MSPNTINEGYKLRPSLFFTTTILISFLTGCAGSPVHTSSLSPYELTKVDNYTLCKGATPREAYYPAQTVLNEVQRRNLNCAAIYTYRGTAGLDAAAAILNNATQTMRPQGNSYQIQTPTAFLRSQSVSGLNRICVYDRMGSTYVVTVRAAEMCPASQ